MSDGYLDSVKEWLDDILSGAVGELGFRLVSRAIEGVCRLFHHLVLNAVFLSILSCSGGIDLLLHLLSSIVDLPVTKATVKSSGMGRAIGTIEKHSICKGTQNEAAIKTRVQQVKDAWNASVKALKSAEKASEPSKSGEKRASEQSPPTSPSPLKRAKVSTDKPKKTSSSFSSLLTKISGPGSQEKVAPAASESASEEVSDNSKPNGSSKRTCIQ